MKEQAIGIFDSGLGGLTAVREIQKIMPNEDIIYFGDTGRVPYGSKSKDAINKYARQDARFLKRWASRSSSPPAARSVQSHPT